MPHIHERIDFTVEVFVVYQNRVLLRKHDKYGIWLSVGGHIELEEDPNQAAVREVKEEVGLDVVLAADLLIETETNERYRELIPPRFLNRHRINDSHEHITLTYFAHSATDSVTNEGEERSDALRWFSEEELNDPQISVPIRTYAKRALLELG
jgi:8-oxo-dGTP pyrophosphatase MutT (NUDIX family)